MKRILLEKNAIKKILCINEFDTSNYASHLLPHIFKHEKNFKSDLESLSLNELPDLEKDALKKFAIDITDSSLIYSFSRIKVDNFIFNTSIYEKNHKRCSSYAKWIFNDETQYGMILKFIKFNNIDLFIAKKFNILRTIESINISTKYIHAFKKGQLEKYFIVASTMNVSYVCCPVISLQANCINVQVATENFSILTEVFDYEHD